MCNVFTATTHNIYQNKLSDRFYHICASCLITNKTDLTQLSLTSNMKENVASKYVVNLVKEHIVPSINEIINKK